MRSRLITGLAGPDLSSDERRFLAEIRPAGIILFARNCESHDQIRRLVQEAHIAVGSDDFVVAIDQEGGRVQRLRPPLGRDLPPGRRYGMLYETGSPEAAVSMCRSVYRLLADDLRSLGINMDCAPVLDVPVPGADGIIGDRAFSSHPRTVIALGQAVAEGLAAGGVVPVVKHVPGHGRATCDSHLALPTVSTRRSELLETDFEPFRALAGAAAAMTAHVVYSDIDPEAPATTSARVIGEIVRGEIGFTGLLMSDDLSMRALAGPMRQRAEASLSAGCDVVLHCNGDFPEMLAVAEGTSRLDGEALSRFERAMAVTRKLEAFDRAEAEAALEKILPGTIS